MDIEVIQTKDGSPTLYSKQFDEIYHSRNGAIAESEHVFIRNGLEVIDGGLIPVFEAGFGSGLNALLSWIYAESKGISITYHTIELFPLSPEIIARLNFPGLPGHSDKFQRIHDAEWDRVVALSHHFSLHKIKGSLIDFQFPSSCIDVIFFDAFSPEKQPELWTSDVFARMYDMLMPGGILVTYCSKSVVRRCLQQVGFHVTKPSGPPGKRDMVRAMKPV